jgi:predicted SPOUT superfamily RNA methylase MTH1
LTFRGRKLCIALPDTALEEHSSLRDKTVKLGMIARTCSIFGVDLIAIFRDNRGRGEASLMKKILQYLETPQYLRKRLFQLDETLKYAGLLPPLRIPSHKPKIPVEGVRVGELREGVVVEGNRVDVGLEAFLKLRDRTSINKRVTVRITKVNPLEGVAADKTSATAYWGYDVEIKSVSELLTDGRYKLKIATSRYGDRLDGVIRQLKIRFGGSDAVMLLFGSPSHGLLDIIGNELKQRVDFVVNLYAEQHVITVRMEEAIGAALYLINLLSIDRQLLMNKFGGL